jgi:hypothetical protein
MSNLGYWEYCVWEQAVFEPEVDTVVEIVIWLLDCSAEINRNRSVTSISFERRPELLFTHELTFH